MSGAIYDLQAPSASTQVAIGAWNRFIIEANGPRIQVTLNGQLVNDYQSTREQTGYIALQARDFLSHPVQEPLHSEASMSGQRTVSAV